MRPSTSATAILAALVASTCGCYLFSDEPKARKKTDDNPVDQAADEDREVEDSKPAEPVSETNECPAVLTGVESQARVIASSCAPVHVRGQYRVDGGSLRIEAGVELRFEPGAVLEVGRDQPGTIIVAGTPEQPVRMVADSVSDSGGWQGLRLHAGADGSSLEQLELTGAGTQDQAALWILATQVNIEGLTVRGAAGLGLELASGRGPELLDVELSGAGVVARATPAAAAGLHDMKLEPTAFVAISAGVVGTTIEWPPNPYRVEGVVRVEGEPELPAQLSLAPGVRLYFMPEARIVVGGLGPGTLSASAAPPPLPLPAPDGAPPPLSPPPSPLAGLTDGSISMRAAQDNRPGSWAGIHVQDGGQLTLRHVELAHGGARDEGVVLAEGSASLTVEGCRFDTNLVGIELRGVGVKVETLTNNEFVDVPVALRTSPALLGGLGPDNRYDEHARIHVERGKVEADATWIRQDAPILIHGDVFVDKGATLTLPAGSHLGFDPGVILGVGYYERATLDIRGSDSAPVVLEPASSAGLRPGEEPAPEPELEPEPEPWGGVVLGAHTSKARFEHVELRRTSNSAGIELRDTADATLVKVNCAGCVGGTVKWGCESTVGNIGVTASEGTPQPMLPPSSCK